MMILAHRGGHDPEHPGVRENTLDAFAAAAATGADGVELDVRRSADGRLVVHHDPVLADGTVLSAVAAADLPAWVPQLSDALAGCRDMTMVDIELKNSPMEPGYDPAHHMARAVAELVAGDPRVLVSSFNLATIDAVVAHAPDIRTGWLTLAAYDQHRAMADARQRGHRALNPPLPATTPDVVAAAHDAGLDVVTWTVNEADQMRAVAAMGVDVMVTDRPALAVAVLRG